jgi:CDP-6-deoxy-D-xylo-4-hexulose-3-dehydrase
MSDLLPTHIYSKPAFEGVGAGWVREMRKPQAFYEQHPDIDKRFLFVNQGYNLRLTELQAAFGSVQLPKLAGFVDIRRSNNAEWQKDFPRWGAFFELQQETPSARSSCFSFPIVVREESVATSPSSRGFAYMSIVSWAIRPMRAA